MVRAYLEIGYREEGSTGKNNREAGPWGATVQEHRSRGSGLITSSAKSSRLRQFCQKPVRWRMKLVRRQIKPVR